MYITGLYLSLFLLSIFALFLLLRRIVNKRAGYYIVLFTLISVVCLAYFAYSIANDASMALVANQFSYLDGTFVLLFFLLCVLDICGFDIHRFWGIPLTMIGLLFLGLAFTTGKNTYFYAKYWYGVSFGAAHIESEFGPLYNFYIIYVILITLAPIGIIIYSIFNKHKISIRYTLALGAIEMSIVIIYFIQNILGLAFDLLPCGYVIMEYVILGIIHRIALYDGSRIVVADSEKRKEFGYIVFDRRKAYIGSNEMARFFFPEVDELYIDSQVENEFIKREFVEHLETSVTEIEKPRVYERNGRMVSCLIKPYIFDGNNKVYGYMVEIRDDTEQQLLIREANRANNAKSDFLASMSHEIRTPINAILGMNEIALRECDDPQIVSYLNEIGNAGNNLLFLINDILDLSRVESGKIGIIDEEYSIVQLIRDIKDMIEVKSSEKGLKLEVEVGQTIPSVLYGDRNRIRQVVINILNNAVKYTHNGFVRLRVIVNSMAEDTAEIQFVISDSGIGIRKEAIPVLFDSFSRLDEEKNKNIEGTGLGLAITKRLVDLMGGTIEVESIYGEGTTFSVSLPQRVIDSTPIGDFESLSGSINGEKTEQTHVDATGLNVLVVDDSRVNLMVVQGLLKQTKAMVDLCKSGAECLEMIARKHYDVILLDHMMPEMDGIETLSKARTLEGNMSSDAWYVALTANAISGVKEMYLEAGFDDYISKPIDSGLLEATLEQIKSKKGKANE